LVHFIFRLFIPFTSLLQHTTKVLLPFGKRAEKKILLIDFSLISFFYLILFVVFLCLFVKRAKCFVKKVSRFFESAKLEIPPPLLL